MRLNKILAQLNEFRRHFFLNAAEKWMVSYNRQVSNPTNSSRTLKVLIQMPESYCEFILFSSLIRSLKRDGFNLNLNWIIVSCAFQRAGKLGWLKRNKWFERKWTKLYLSNGGNVAFSNIFYKKKLRPDLIDRATAIFDGLKNKETLINFKFDDIKIGDLIYDTYLRFKPAPTLDIRDPFLKEILINSLHIFDSAKRYISEGKPEILITAYGTYIHHGIMVRLALSNNIKVISFGSYDQVAKRINLKYPLHAKDYFNYPQTFKSLSIEVQNIAKESAGIHLDRRFKGGKDLQTHYMASSAFAANSTVAPIFSNNGKKRIVIFLHCFFDSPHAYRWMLYPDFYEWFYQTLKILSEFDYDIYVKQHPNGLPGNDEIIAEIKEKFINVKFLPVQTSGIQMAQEGFDLGLTVHGTLAHEYPYLGIPILNAGDNPHIEYDFCVHAKSIEEYSKYLSQLNLIPKPTASDKDKILEFYYMHNIHTIPGRLKIEEMQFVNENSRKIVSDEDFVKHIEKYYEPEFVKNLDRLVYKSFLEVFSQ